MKIQAFPKTIEDALRSHESPPRVFEGFFSANEISWLLEQEQLCEKVEKAGGVINYKYAKGGAVEKFIEEKVSPYFGKLVRHGGSFVKTPVAFHAHTDTGKADEMKGKLFPYKNILIPLQSSTPAQPLYTVFFRQRNFGEASHFWNAKEFETRVPFYNHKVTDYSGLAYRLESSFNPEDHEKHLSHLPIESLNGLSISETIHWKLGDLVAFDCSTLHASNNFEKFGAVKHGLSYFGSKEIAL